MSTYSGNLGTNLIATGDLAGTWGDVTNTNLGTLMEQAISSYCTQQFNNTDVTLLMANGADATTNPAGTIYTAGTVAIPVSARNMYIECQGTSSGNYLFLPLNRKLYFVYNNITSGGGTITVAPVSGPGASVDVPVGGKYLLACDGTNIVNAIANLNYVGAINSVPRFASLNSLVAGSITDTGTSVGINNASPTNALDVNGTATFTTIANTRINPRVSTTTSASSVTPNISSVDMYTFSALAANLTINAPIGASIATGNKLLFRIKDNGTSRTLTWNATYVGVGVVIPTATAVNATIYIGCIYNADLSRWDVIAVSTD